MPDPTTTPQAVATAAPAPATPAPTSAPPPDLSTMSGRREAAARAIEANALENESKERAAAPAVTPAEVQPPADAAPATPEAPKEAPSKHLAALVERERKVLAMERQFKEQAARFEALEKAKSTAHANPLELLQQHGLSFEQVQDFVLNGKQPTVEAKQALLEREVQALKAAREAEANAAAQRQQQAEVEAAKGHWKETFKQQAAASQGKFELATLYGDAAADMGTQVFEGYMAQYGQPPQMAWVLDAVEKHYDALTGPLLTSQRLKARLAPAAPAQPSTAPPPASASGPTSPPRTLTNSLSAAPPKGESKRVLSRDELRALAEAAVARQMRGE